MLCFPLLTPGPWQEERNGHLAVELVHVYPPLEDSPPPALRPVPAVRALELSSGHVWDRLVTRTPEGEWRPTKAMIASGFCWRIVEDNHDDHGEGRGIVLEIQGGSEVADIAVRICRPAGVAVNEKTSTALSRRECLYTIELTTSPAAKNFYRDGLGLVPASSHGTVCGTPDSTGSIMDPADSVAAIVSRLSISDNVVAGGHDANTAAEATKGGFISAGTVSEASAASLASTVHAIDLSPGEGSLGPVRAHHVLSPVTSNRPPSVTTDLHFLLTLGRPKPYISVVYAIPIICLIRCVTHQVPVPTGDTETDTRTGRTASVAPRKKQRR